MPVEEELLFPHDSNKVSRIEFPWGTWPSHRDRADGIFMEFSRPEYWSGLPFSSPGDLFYPGIEPRSPALQADSLPAEPQRKHKNTGVHS